MMMKRYTTVLLLLVIASSTSLLHAQRVAAPILRNTDPPPQATHPTALIAHPRTDPIWTDDFSDAANWTIGMLDSTNDNWVIGTTGPAGDFAIPAIQSTSAANGFALFDSDVMCDTDNGYIATASPTDLSAHAHVQLQFEQFYRRSQGHTFVDVSNDSITWTPFEVNAAHHRAVHGEPGGLHLEHQFRGGLTVHRVVPLSLHRPLRLCMDGG